MKRFANLADAGRALAECVLADIGADASSIVLAAVPNGVPVALPVAAALGVSAAPLPVERRDEGPVIGALPEVSGRRVIIVDDGVETGSVARAAASAVRALGPERLVLAVPVCPRDAMADLVRRYDAIIAVERPFGRRSLAWHFDDFDTLEPDAALAMLRAQG